MKYDLPIARKEKRLEADLGFLVPNPGHILLCTYVSNLL